MEERLNEEKFTHTCMRERNTRKWRKTMKENAQKGRVKTKWIIILVFLCLAAAAAAAAVGIFHVTEVEVQGNVHYTEEEIKELVMAGPYSTNSLYLMFKYKYLDTQPIPFIDTIEITMLSPHKVRIKVYEKSVVGYIEYLGTNMYFDKDGVVVESSDLVMEEVPLITGLSFDSIVLYKKLPVRNQKVFRTIVDLTQMLDKQNLRPDRIEFTDDIQMNLYFGSIEVLLGKDENLFDKIDVLKSALPIAQQEEMVGIMHMEEVSETQRDIKFERTE